MEFSKGVQDEQDENIIREELQTNFNLSVY